MDIADWLRAHSFAGLPGGVAGVRQLAVVPSKVVGQRPVPVGEIPDAPDRVVALRISSGAPTAREFPYEAQVVQALTRGLQDDPADGEAVAAEVDNALMAVVPPLSLGARRVVSIDRSGGPPTFIDRDSSGRDTYSCNYVLMVDREAL